MVGGEKLYKVSVLVKDEGNLCSYWISPQKGYNLVRIESESKMYDAQQSYSVTLHKFTCRKGEVWFPQETFYRDKMNNRVSEERIVVDSIDFDVQDETPFTLAGLGIPIGYQIDHFSGVRMTWDGKELVGNIPFVFEPVNRVSGWRKIFLIINAAIFAFFALWFLIKWIKLLRCRSN